MSAVSGLNAKAEKGRSKYVALDINSIYKGKSLENPKATVQPKHGLQSLGKVGAGRRMPPPANLPSLKSENSGNNPNISLVPSGGQGWGSTTKEKGKTEETNGSQQQSPQSQPASSLSQTTQKTSTTNTVSTSGANKTWSSVTQNQEDGGQERNFLGQQSPFFPQEFPKLAGGDVPTEGNQKSSVDSQYGPGPSLRPQTEGSWGRGTLQQPAGSAGGPPQNSGSGVNGPQPPTDAQHPRQYSTAPRPTAAEAPMGPASALHPPPQFRGMMPSFMYGRNSFPSGYPSNFPNVPPPPQQNARPSYPYSENRRPQPVRPLAEEEAYQRPAAIITEKALKGFDEILQNDTQDTWATSHGEIDYNAKIVFSDDEESSANQKKDKRDAEDKSSKSHSSIVKNDKERDRKPDRERSGSERERENRPPRDSEWARDRTDKKSEHDADWNFERGEGFERERHGNYPPPRPARSGPRSSSSADDDEMWRQRRKQHTEEMTMTVERARQRRAEEEKHYEQSKQSAQEKAKTFEKGDKEKDLEHEDADRSRHSSESREDKPSSRDGRERDRDRDRSQPNYQGYNFSRQFQKNVPPRFQKQAAEYMRQQTQQPMPGPPNQAGQGHFLRSQSVGQTSPGVAGPVSNSPLVVSPQPTVPMPINYEQGWATHPPYPSQMSVPPTVAKEISRQRSTSQGSASDSYESDTCPPEQNVPYDREPRDNYWNRDRRQTQSGYESWHGPANDGYFDQKAEASKAFDQRHDFKKPNLEKEEKSFDAHQHETERRNKDFETQDYRYKARDSFKDSQKYSESRESKEKGTKSSSWARDYEERVPDPFDEPHEASREKPIKDRADRYERQEKERWEKDRPARPDSRDSRASKESAKEDRHTSERGEVSSSQPERERKSAGSKEDKKDKPNTMDWGESPYPVESKRREWHHHPPPITPKQFESIGPPKKNLTPLRRSNAPGSSANIPEKKADSIKVDSTNKKVDLESVVKKDKEAKEEKNEKIKNESVTKDGDKHVDKYDHFEKSKSLNKEVPRKSEIESCVEIPKKETVVTDDKEKSRNDKEKHEHSLRNEQNRDRRRDRGGNSRSRGGNAFMNNSQPPIGGGGNARYESSRGRGGNSTRPGAYVHATPNVQPNAPVSGGVGTYRGKREYRRSKVERGPRFERQKDKLNDDKKEKHSDDTSCSEVDDSKLGHLRQKDEDSEVSVDEASASTTESAQAEKYQNSEIAQEDDKNCITELSNVSKDIISKNDKFKKDKKDNLKGDPKPYEDRLKEEKGGFAPRGEPSRRGRGGGNTLSFRNSRGGSRYGPSSYGPPPSRAGFGGIKPEKLEEHKIIEENFNDGDLGDFKMNMSTVENLSNEFNREPNKSRSLERPQQRRPARFDHLPPRFQKRHDRRLEKFEQPSRGRGRGRSNVYPGATGQLITKMGQGGKENLSDVANEEWETASESSDVADRRERHDDKDDLRKRDHRGEKGSTSRKSFSGQRPVNESTQGRRMNNESRRGGPGNPNPGDRNRQRETFPRETRSRDSGRGRQNNNFGNASDRRMTNNNNGNNSRPSSSAGHPGGMGRNNSRGGNPSKAGPFQPKNEGTAAVYRVDEIKLQDPNGVQAALTDLTNRRNMKAEVAIAKVPKSDKEKACGLEGYDLNNYASVVIIDDHPEVTDDPNLICGTDDGFQEVTSKKRHKIMVESEVKKMKKEPHTRNKSGSRSRQSRLPPRFAKQRESIVKSVSVAPTTAWEINVDLSPRAPSAVKDASPAPPVNAWEKPINHSLRSLSPVVTSLSTTCTNTVVSSCTSVASADIQALAATSKSSSFDRSDQHDSGIDVSDQPASAASSQRSSPSNDCKIITPISSGKNNVNTEVSDLVTEIDACKPMCTVVFENKNFKAENAVLDKFGGQSKNQTVKDTATSCENLVLGSSSKSKDSIPDTEEKPHSMPVSFSPKESFGKGEETTDMKLDFNFDSGLERLTEDKNARSSNGSSHLPNNKSINIARSMEVSNNGSPVGVQSPISPSTDDLNLKIQSVKKVWENDPPLPTVMEHPQPVSEESPTTYNSYTSTSESTTVYNSTVDSNSQNRKETDGTDMAFRESSPLQQACSSSSALVKNMEHTVSVKSQMQLAAQHNTMSGPHCPAPLSPPLMGGLEAMTGIRTIAGLASSVQVASIPAIPSPPTVLFNSSQQMAQSGMYQPLQMDSRQTNAVAAAMVQFGQSPHGYAPMGTYGLSHQPPPNPQLSNAYGQQSLFVQPPATHQGQDIYSSNQYRVQPPYGQNQHVSSNQVLSAQQNLASSHLLGSQLVQTRPATGPSPAGSHLQSLHSLQAVQAAPQTSYFSTSAQPQTASYYHQPPTTPGSPMQQQPQYPSHQSYGSQSAMNVLPQAASVNPSFRNFGNHQFKAQGMNNIVPDSSSLRSSTRSPTINDVSANRNMFSASTAVSTALNSAPVVAVPPSTGVIGKHGQPQGSALAAANRIAPTQGKTSQFSIPQQSQQHYYPFGQKFSHVQSNPAVRPQVLFPNVVRNAPHQQIPAVAAATASNLHYPPPIQRPGPATVTQQAAPQPQPPKIGIRAQASLLVPGGKLTSAQQAKLRAEAVQQTHMFFAQSKTGKHEETVPGMIPQDKNIQPGVMQKMPMSNSGEVNEAQCLSTNETPQLTNDGIDANENAEGPAVEE